MSIFTTHHLFIHIPKTAGASIITTIKTQQKINKVPNNRTVYDNYHSTANDCIPYIKNIDELFKFTVVRNPWDRATSWFFFRKGVIENNINNPKKVLTNDKALLEKELEIMNQGFNYWLEEYISQPWDFTWFSLANDQCTWLDNIDLNLVIKYENLNEELSNIPNLNLEKLPKRHQSKNSKVDYRKLYNNNSIDTIQKIYKRDIERFGYNFE